MPSGRTHMAAGMFASAYALYQLGGPLEYTFIGGVAGLLPDIDHHGSKLGRFTPLWLCLKHRGFTHSYVATVFITILTYYFGNPWMALAVFTGYLSHIWLDYTTPSGVMLWWPRRGRRSLRKLLHRR